MHKGIELHKSGKVEVAAQLYSVVLKEQPDHPDANHNMGVLAVGIGKIQEALPFFETALEANADVAQFWVSYIDTLMRVTALISLSRDLMKWAKRNLKLILPAQKCILDNQIFWTL